MRLLQDWCVAATSDAPFHCSTEEQLDLLDDEVDYCRIYLNVYLITKFIIISVQYGRCVKKESIYISAR